MTYARQEQFSLLLFSNRLALYLSATLILFVTKTVSAEAAMESHFIYFPETALRMTPANVGLDYEDVVFPAEDGTMLHGWFIAGEKNRPVILFFHGNAGNISDRVDNLVKLNQAGLPVFIFDYRGYGRSQGKPSETGTYSDGRGAIIWLKSKGYDQHNSIYFGRSLGAAVAMQMTLEYQPSGLIMESPFSAIADMGKQHYPLLSRLFGWLISARYDNRAKMAQLQSPLLLIHGTADTIVPVEMGKLLFELAPEPKQLHLIIGADHNDGFYLQDKNYWQAWEIFFSEINTRKGER